MRAWLHSKLSSKRFYFCVWFGLVLLYLLAAGANALTKAPWWDEGLFADPASNLAFHGYLGASVQEPTGRPGGHMFLPDVDRYTFWNMPLYMVMLAGWFKLFGFSILSMRSLSIVCGLLLLIAWYVIVKSLSRSKGLALLAAALVGLDYTILISCSNGRPDCMTAALGSAALAVYLCLRERNYSLAILCSTTLTAAAVFTHPLGLIPTGGLVFLAFYLDFRRIRWIHVPLAVLPYGVAVLAWGLYIAQAPDVFLSQFDVAVGYRTRALLSPFRSILMEFTGRYITYFFSLPHLQGLARLKGLILLGYAVAVLVAVFTPAIRRHRITKVVLFMAALYFVALALLDTEKNPNYFVYIFPLFAVVLAICVWHVWTTTKIPHPVIATAVTGLVALQLSGVAYKVKLNSYRNVYLPMIREVAHYYKAGDLVMGGAELLFGLPQSIPFVDDANVGLYSGKVPDLIVCNIFYPKAVQRTSPNNTRQRYFAELFQKYQLTFANGDFRIYIRRRD